MEHYSSRAGEQEGQPLSYSHNMGQRALSPPSTGRADARERPCIDQTLIMATPSLNNSMTMRASSPPGTGGEGRAPRAHDRGPAAPRGGDEPQADLRPLRCEVEELA